MMAEDVSVAFALVFSGSNVVLVIPEGFDPGPLPDGPGRLAVMVGEPGDPATRAAAAAMDAELFGTER